MKRESSFDGSKKRRAAVKADQALSSGSSSRKTSDSKKKVSFLVSHTVLIFVLENNSNFNNVMLSGHLTDFLEEKDGTRKGCRGHRDFAECRFTLFNSVLLYLLYFDRQLIFRSRKWKRRI